MRSKKAWTVLGVALTLTALAATYPLLGANLRRVGFQFDSWGIAGAEDFPSEWRGKWFWTDDSEFLARVEAWRGDLKRWQSSGALRSAGGRIVLEYCNGRQEEFFTHSLGPTGPGSLVLFHGQHMCSEHEPFSESLRQKFEQE